MAIESAEIGQRVRIVTVRGLYKILIGKEVEVVDVDQVKRVVMVKIDRMPYIVGFSDLDPIAAAGDGVVTSGEPFELLGRVARLMDQLAAAMRAQGIASFGDGARAIAGFEEGKLVIRQKEQS